MFFNKLSIIIVACKILNTQKNPLPNELGWGIFTLQKEGERREDRKYY